MTPSVAEPALLAFEFPAALDHVSRYAVTPLGAARVRALAPLAERLSVESELARVAAFAERLGAGDDLEPVPFPDAGTGLERLAIEGSALDGAELALLAALLGAARQVGAKLRRVAGTAPAVALLAAAPLPAELETALLKSLDPDGRVLDAASRDLARIRSELVALRREIVVVLERLLAGLDERQRAGDAGVTLRNGRYVIPLRRDGRSKIGGIVHDESATHATLFVEPPEAIELGNRLRGLEAEESREVQRVLRELTRMLRPHHQGLAGAFEMLIAADACYARARCAAAWRAAPPRLVDAGTAPLALRGAAHPLLLAEGREVVRFDLVLEPGERTVLISGPNTGGKTVLIKAVGLVAALAQAGVLPPLGEGSVLPVFDGLFADIGDRQSIAESLSTFSAHVAAVRDVLAHAGPGALVLLDELGTGTDPDEGAALAAAVLRALTRRGVTTVATTHLGALKELAGAEPGIVNASLAFDAVTLAPTYRFTKGLPGRSYGLAIARRLGVPDDVLTDAESRVTDELRRLDASLAAAETRAQQLERLAADLDARRLDQEGSAAALDRFRAELMAREDALAREQKELARSKKAAAREALLAARAEVERALALAHEGRDKEARRALEAHIASLGHGAQPHRQDVASSGEPFSPVRSSLVPGLKVRIRSLGVEGEIESVRGDEVAIRVRGRKVRVRASDLAAAS